MNNKFSNKEKASFLNCISDEILALGDELIEVFILESGLPEGRALGERTRTVSQLQAFAKMIQTDEWKNNIIEKALPDRKPSPKPDIRKTYIPIGPIAIFTPSNFPLAYSSAGGDTASALASGCSVVVKAHYMHSGTAELVSSAIINSVKKNKNKSIHNATKVFQALRIFVNKEISELIYGLIKTVKIIDTNGLILLISFHSLEDKIIKFFFKNLSEQKKISRYYPEPLKEKKVLKLGTKKPILPSKQEIRINNPSRSAKLRYAIKIGNEKNFEKEFLKEFEKLLEIESLSKKL